MIGLQSLLLAVLILACPVAAGSLLTGKQKNIRMGEFYVRGFALMLAVFQLAALPVFFMGLPLHVLTVVYLILLTALTAAGLIWKHRVLSAGLKKTVLFRKPCWPLAAALILIAVQTVVCGTTMHLDQDDAFYIGTAVTSVNTDSIFKYDCYTGAEYAVLPSRYILSPFPIFLAVLAQISGMHPTIIAHTVFPLVLIPLSYYVYWLIGRQMFQQSRDQAAVFLLLVSVVQMFSYYSVYTAGAFLLLRIWQGKAVLANILLPAVFYLGLLILDKKRMGTARWIWLACLNTASCLVSTMGFMLAPIMVGIMAIVSAFRKRSWTILLKAALCCVPNVIFSVIYLMIR